MSQKDQVVAASTVAVRMELRQQQGVILVVAQVCSLDICGIEDAFAILFFTQNIISDPI